jgi:hypothetical protein
MTRCAMKDIITVEGGDHSWAINNNQALINWFEKYLGKK